MRRAQTTITLGGVAVEAFDLTSRRPTALQRSYARAGHGLQSLPTRRTGRKPTTLPDRSSISMFTRLARRPSPALVLALLALFAGTAGVTYAATQGPPSFTADGVASVAAGSKGAPLPITGAN